MFAEWIDLKVNLFAVPPHHDLALQVHGDMSVAAELAVLDQLFTDGAREADRQDAVFETIVKEDVGEIRRDNATNAEIQQSPRCVFPR